MNILICGDSFASDFSKEYPNCKGWVNLLTNDYTVNNIAQAGVSEYKILKQIESINPSDFDAVIIVHTSPYRVHIKHHPVHQHSILRNNCDLLYEDILHHNANSDNKCLNAAEDYFKYIFDEDYYLDCYHLMQEKIKKLTDSVTTLNIGILYDNNFVNFNHFMSLRSTFIKQQGQINHFNDTGNVFVYNTVKQWLVKYVQ
jgi:hypothetical protein